MSEPTIECPKCGRVIALTEAVARRVEERARQEVAQEVKRLKRDFERRAAVKEKEYDDLLAQHRADIEERATKLGLKEGREEGAREREALQAGREKLAEQLAIAEKRRRRDEIGWKQRIDELQRRADLRDRSHFGPEGEEQLVATLKAAFPDDTFKRLGRSGDVLHTIILRGHECGTIVYECKRVQKLQPAAVRQLKSAMAAHDTRYGVLVSNAAPAGRPALCTVKGVMVVAPGLVEHIVAVIRDGLLAVANLRLSDEGRGAKEAELLAYVRSDDLVNAFRRIEDQLSELRESLNREKSHHTGTWMARERSYASLLRDALGVDMRLKAIMRGKGRLRQVS